MNSRPHLLAMLGIMVEEAIDNLHGAQQRAVLALVGIVIGAASVVALINIGENAATESMRQFQSMGTDVLVIQNGLTMPGADYHPLTMASINEMSAAIGVVSVAAPISSASATVRFHDKSVDTSAVGVTPELVDLARLQLRQGRFVSEFDGYETFAVIGRGLADSLGAEGIPVRVGEKLRIDDYLFVIVGILENTVRNPLIPVDFNQSVMIPLKATRRALTSDGKISSVLIKISERADPIGTAVEVSEYFKTKGSGIQVQSASQLIETLRKQSQLFTFLLAGIGAISLIVGGIGVMNVMLAGIAERRREIGVRMAIGALQQDVLTMIMLEASALSIIGGCLGSLLGLMTAYLFANFSGWEFSFFLLSFLAGLGMSLLVGLFFGIYPAFKASQMVPVEALRAD